MSIFRRTIGSRGFTLIELLVVIAIIAMLAAILVPAVNSALLSASLAQAKSNGRSIYIAVFAKDLDQAVVQDTSVAFPSTGQFSNNSTDYFKYLVTNNILNVTWSFFAPRGVTPAQGTTATDFFSTNNGWCVVADLTESTPDGTPFVFTRNLGGTTTATGKANLQAQMVRDRQPFGDKGLVVVFKGGSAIELKGNQIQYVNFNPADVTNSVMRPGAGL